MIWLFYFIKYNSYDLFFKLFYIINKIIKYFPMKIIHNYLNLYYFTSLLIVKL